MLQLVPPHMSEDARRLADDALAAAGVGARRMVIHRPLTQTWDLIRRQYRGARVVMAVGEAAASAFAADRPLIYLPDGESSRLELMALRRCGALWGVATSAGAAARLRVSGPMFSGVTVVRPDMRLPRARAARDEALRGELGIGADHRLLFAPGIATRESGHYLALWVTSILSFSQEGCWKLLISGDGPYVRRLLRFALQNDPSALVLAKDRLAGFTTAAGLAACDLAVDLSPTSTQLRPMLEARAVGVPVLVAAGNAAVEVCDAGQVMTELNARAIARRLLLPATYVAPSAVTGNTAVGWWKSLLAGMNEQAEVVA